MAFGGSISINDGVGVIVCGSPGEIANDPTLGGGAGYGSFDFQSDQGETTGWYLENQVHIFAIAHHELFQAFLLFFHSVDQSGQQFQWKQMIN